MSTSELVDLLRQRGLSLKWDGAKVALVGPPAAATPKLLRALALRRAELTEALRPAPAVECLYPDGRLIADDLYAHCLPYGPHWWRPRGEKGWRPIPGMRVTGNPPAVSGRALS